MPAAGADTIALVARLLIGWLFLDYGWMKLLGHDGTVRYLANLHVPMPELMYWPVMLAELVIGVALILGIATRYTSLFTFIYLIIATAIAPVIGRCLQRQSGRNTPISAKTSRSWAAHCCSTCLAPDGSHSTLGCVEANSPLS